MTSGLVKRVEAAFSRRPARVALGLFLVFSALYLVSGLRLFADDPWRNDEFFEIDAARVADWMTRPDALHLRTRVHPIYVLLVNPLGLTLQALLGSRLWVVQGLTASFSALAVALCYLGVVRWKGDPWLALGISCLFGVSASQMLLGAVPDTTALATCSLAASLCLFVRDSQRERISYPAWVAVGVFALGVTSTNVVVPLCLFLGLCWKLSAAPTPGTGVGRLLLAGRRGLVWTVAVLVLTASLALVQQALYSNTKLFFQPALVQHEITKFASLVVLDHPGAVLPEVVKHFLLAAVVSPLPQEIWIHERPAVTFVGSFVFAWPGVVAALCWGGLCTLGALRFRKGAAGDGPLYAACACALGFQLLMHCFYGVAERGKMEFFLYTGNSALLVILLASSGCVPGRRAGRAAVAVLVLFTAWNSLEMLDRAAWMVGRGG